MLTILGRLLSREGATSFKGATVDEKKSEKGEKPFRQPGSPEREAGKKKPLRRGRGRMTTTTFISAREKKHPGEGKEKSYLLVLRE